MQSRETLVELTRRTVAHARAGTAPLADKVGRVPASNYYDPQRWQLEMQRVFRRTPLVAGFSAELREPHSYKSIEIAGTPVLITRTADGSLKAHVNMCSHRGAMVVEPGTGTSRRFTCPYHAWNYDSDGALVGILDRDEFGDIDPSCHGLTPLPCDERAGVVFVGLEPNGTIDLDQHLCGYGEMLDHLGLADCNFVGSQSVGGPNWKVAYDGYLDFYHLPISSPDQRSLAVGEVGEDNWTAEHLTTGVWTIFPHVSIAGFKVEAEGGGEDGGNDGGGRMYMVSTLYPGDDADTSVTVQNFLAAFEPTEELQPVIEAQMKFLLHVVRDEDYFTGNRIQRAVKTGAKTEFLFGRNEAGGQRFHGWVDRLVAAETSDDFNQVFAGAETVFQR